MLWWLQRLAKDDNSGFGSYRTLAEFSSSYIGMLKTYRVLCWLQSYAKGHSACVLWPLGYADAHQEAVVATGIG